MVVIKVRWSMVVGALTQEPANELFQDCLLHERDHIGGEDAMTVIFFVGPCCLGTGQALTIR